MTITQTASVATLDQLSTEELEMVLAKRKEEQRKEEQRRKAEYEQTRDALVTELVRSAIDYSNVLKQFKKEAFDLLKEFQRKMQEYSGNERETKGNFQIRSENENYKIVFKRHVSKGYDERAAEAEALLKEYMQTMVKKRDLQSYNIIMALLERNSVTGDYDPNLIGKLIKRKGDSDDPRWVKAIDLFIESWSEVKTVEYAQFYTKDDTGAWVAVPLNFSAIAI